MRRSVIFSALFHLLVLMALLLSLPAQKLPDTGEGATYEVQFEAAPKAPTKGPVARKSPTPSPAPTQPTPPKPTPPVPETAPPPPPPPAPPKTEIAQTTPTPAKPIPTPPTPAVIPTPTPVEKPKPVQKAAAQASIPTPPIPVAAPPSQSSTSQPHETKNPQNDSTALENTLAKLRSVDKSDQPPTAVANPDSGGAAEDSGNPNSDSTSKLTGAEMGAIGDKVRPCWSHDTDALNADKLQVMLTVTTGPDGVVHVAHVADADIARVNGSTVLRAFAERAVNAVLDARCATLPLPQSMLGQNQTFTFMFKP